MEWLQAELEREREEQERLEKERAEELILEQKRLAEMEVRETLSCASVINQQFLHSLNSKSRACLLQISGRFGGGDMGEVWYTY